MTSAKVFPPAAWRALLVGLAAVGLAGCFTVKLTSEYDDQIDAGVTQVLAETTAFVNKMAPLAGTPAGAYEPNKDFYTTEEGRIAALQARADAHRVLNLCPSTAVIAKAVTGVGGLGPIASDPNIKAKFEQYAAGMKTGDCEDVMLSQLYAEMEDLKGFHRAQGPLGIPTQASGPILVGGIGSTVRIIMAVEAAKKAGQAQGN